jgi:hypothetical protein
MAMTRLLTLNEISRKLDVPYQTLLAMTRRGELLPNSISGRYFLFDSSRLTEIAQFVDGRRKRVATYPC